MHSCSSSLGELRQCLRRGQTQDSVECTRKYQHALPFLKYTYESRLRCLYRLFEENSLWSCLCKVESYHMVQCWCCKAVGLFDHRCEDDQRTNRKNVLKVNTPFESCLPVVGVPGQLLEAVWRQAALEDSGIGFAIIPGRKHLIAVRLANQHPLKSLPRDNMWDKRDEDWDAAKRPRHRTSLRVSELKTIFWPCLPSTRSVNLRRRDMCKPCVMEQIYGGFLA